MKRIQRINVPHTTRSGVEIGVRYTRPMPPMSRDEELIQSALLGERSYPRVPVWVVVTGLILCYVLVSCVGARGG